jgi:hypothetical protein
MKKKNSPAFSEKLTRKQLIDRGLIAAGWRVVPEKEFDSSNPLRVFDRCAIEEYPTDNGPADYALCAEGKILGIVEGKKLSPRTACSTASLSSASPLTIRTRPSHDFSFSGLRTSAVISWPRSIPNRTICWPTLPVAPRTKTFIERVPQLLELQAVTVVL